MLSVGVKLKAVNISVVPVICILSVDNNNNTMRYALIWT